ncbi:SOS response-associated peptidase family protein [Roseateles cellulosilyticus]|uniref:SOS response-associated peptidase family protein n=1 Tax=Pelomonas cellulosilytica TaxID=2906762 RepID=A0ABS8Y622_9BURK|nr:SOS response-associated peptidase family protein [Pelomonas sp. P8]MCE4558075.1 SOS response-associated peptidase family protein [Pelomonas sp. P8]
MDRIETRTVLVALVSKDPPEAETTETQVGADPGEGVSDAIIQFKPDYGHPMSVACVWSEWKARKPDEEDLLSVAFITDEPPQEVSDAGHERCVIPLRRENLAAWLSPDANDLAAQYAILDDRERPVYDHDLEAAQQARLSARVMGQRAAMLLGPSRPWRAPAP